MDDEKVHNIYLFETHTFIGISNNDFIHWAYRTEHCKSIVFLTTGEPEAGWRTQGAVVPLPPVYRRP